MSTIIKTDRLILKKIELKDIDQLIKNLNNFNITKWLINVRYPYTINDAKNWIKKSTEEDLCLNIYHQKFLIGGITIDKRKEDKSHVLGYWIGEEYWGRGYALEACKAIISYFFLNSSKIKIYASHMAENEKSKKILLSLGFNKINDGRVYSISREMEVEDINYELIKS